MRVRTWTALVSAAIFLGSLHSGLAWPFLVVLAVPYLVGLAELGTLLGWGWKSHLAAFLVTLAGGAAVWTASGSAVGVFSLLSVLFVVGCLGILWRKVDRPHPMAWLGTGWLLMPVLCMALVHLWWKGGVLHPLALYTMSLFLGDTMALVVGKAVGRTPLAPSLSAGKTWEGAMAGFAASVAAALGFGVGFGYSGLVSLLVGLCAGLLGIAGDLFESFAKRRQGMKDSGGFFPGHGGVLDRVDSMMFSAIPSCVLLVLLEPGMFHVKHLGDLVRW